MTVTTEEKREQPTSGPMRPRFALEVRIEGLMTGVRSAAPCGRRGTRERLLLLAGARVAELSPAAALKQLARFPQRSVTEQPEASE